MYQINRVDGTEIAIAETIVYIKIGDSGDFTPTNEEESIGVAVNSTPYNLMGFDAIDGAETVVVSKCDAASKIAQQQALIDELVLTALGV